MTSKAYIFYDNLLTSPLLMSVTPTSERAGYSVENAYDWRTTTYWSPVPPSSPLMLPPNSALHWFDIEFSEDVTSDYFAVYRHNIFSAEGAVMLLYSDDNVTFHGLSGKVYAQEDNELIIKTFAPMTARYWRVAYFSETMSQLYLGVVMFGQALNLYRGMPPGFILPHQARKNTIMNQKTEGGQFAGRAITSRGAKTTILNKAIPANWYRENIEPFILHAEKFPFLFSWNHTDRPSDACWCETDGDIPDAPIDENYRQNLNIPVNCLLSGVL